MVKITETPRDGLQGITNIINTQEKIDYINLLLRCGFHTIEAGSFVSPALIPQMADTAEVLRKINTNNSVSRIAVLVASLKGAEMAMNFEKINSIIFPFSLSETFLRKNINSNFADVEKRIDQIHNLCLKHNKELRLYFSMGFGNPYGDMWNTDIILKYIDLYYNKGIRIMPFSDILGTATPEVIGSTFKTLSDEFPYVEFGLHLHSTPEQRIEKVNSAWQAGIRSFDTVINGLGGCPQTGKDLVSNLPTEEFLDYCHSNDITTGINSDYFNKARKHLKL